MLVFGIITEALPGDLSVMYNEKIDFCAFGFGYRIGMFALIWVTWIVVAALNWRIRNIKSSFNESREITVACIIVFGVLIFMTALSLAQPKYLAYRALRIAATTLNSFAAMTIWWLMMALPLFKCLTDRQVYLKQWIFKLRQDGLQRAYHVETGTSKGNLSSGEHPYKRHVQADNRHSTQAPICDKDVQYADTNSEFYYGAHNEADIGAALAQGCPNAMISSTCSRNGEGDLHSTSSNSSLVKHQQPLLISCSSMNQAAYLSESLTEASDIHRAQSPSAATRPWEKFTNAVSRLGGSSPALGSKSPIHSPSSPTTARPYNHTTSFSDPAAASQLRLDAAQDSRLNDSYTSDDRQIL
ncbi:hypothetical protein FBU31_006992 [Coemansia sp. 'formosensis']|nr:hypothetical protein FBU31_006992 [Coemansia sp. 'formosensis']